MLTIDDAFTPEAILHVHSLFKEYAASLEVDLCFQGFEQELAALPGDYASPHGRLLLAWWNDEVAGCVALRRIDPNVCEMKRLYVRPEYRSHGVGRALALRIIEEARQAGYRSMRLDSLPSMKSALRLYRTLGFQNIAPYRDNPVEGTAFLELQLTSEDS
jgi:ribosomal protein S18 acetylase RimI-like enzyme